MGSSNMTVSDLALPLVGGVPQMMDHYLGAQPASIDSFYTPEYPHILQLAMKMDREFAGAAYSKGSPAENEAAFLKGAAQCTRMLAVRSHKLLNRDEAGQPWLANEAFNFVGAGSAKQPDNLPMRAEVVLATLYNQVNLTTYVGGPEGYRRDLPLFRPQIKQLAAKAGQKDVTGKMEALARMVAGELQTPQSKYTAEIAWKASKLDPQGFAWWMQYAPQNKPLDPHMARIQHGYMRSFPSPRA